MCTCLQSLQFRPPFPTTFRPSALIFKVFSIKAVFSRIFGSKSQFSFTELHSANCLVHIQRSRPVQKTGLTLALISLRFPTPTITTPPLRNHPSALQARHFTERQSWDPSGLQHEPQASAYPSTAVLHLPCLINTAKNDCSQINQALRNR
jgi:hypothetical protein